MVLWEICIFLSSGYRHFSHPEIGSGDQWRLNLLATIFCSRR
jgi:hypothetical protein